MIEYIKFWAAKQVAEFFTAIAFVAGTAVFFCLIVCGVIMWNALAGVLTGVTAKHDDKEDV